MCMFHAVKLWLIEEKYSPQALPTPSVPPRNVNFSHSMADSSLFFFLQSHSVAALWGVYMALCSIVDALKKHKKHWTGCETEVFVCVCVGGGGLGRGAVIDHCQFIS